MKELDMRDLRAELEDLPTWQLDERLLTELKKEPADGAIVRLILSILKERDRNHYIENSDEVQSAWAKYQGKDNDSSGRSNKKSGWFLKAASIVAIIGVIFFVTPQTAEAGSFWNRIVQWSSSVFEMLSIRDRNRSAVEYEFNTDNHGLQKVHDMVVELGVTDTVVPTWIPETYEFSKCEIWKTPARSKVVALFKDNHSNLIFEVNYYTKIESSKYYKDQMDATVYEIDGTTHNIIQNDGKWVVLWTRDNIECFIVIECQEETLFKILKSIYTVEDK